MLIQNLLLYQDRYFIRVNGENDVLFYFFDYDVRTEDKNMQFQHFHTFYELCVMMGPNTRHILEGKPYDMDTFDIIGIPPNVLHRSQYPPGDPCRRLIIQFNLPRNVTGLSNEYEQLLGIFHREVPIFRFDAELRKQLFSKLNDIFLLAPKTDSKSEMTPMEKKIYSVTSYIHAHYFEDLSLDTLAQKFYISSCYLSHQFKDVTGFTLTDYIQMTRVRNIQSLLINTRVPITEAALSCGFASFSQFNRVFQKHIGMSPSQYRKRNQMLSPELVM